MIYQIISLSHPVNCDIKMHATGIIFVVETDFFLIVKKRSFTIWKFADFAQNAKIYGRRPLTEINISYIQKQKTPILFTHINIS